MRGQRDRIVWAFLCWVVLAACRPSAPEVSGSDLPATREAIEAYLEDFAPRVLEEGGVTGASIVLLEQGEPVWTYVYGTANQETGEPITPQTRFNVGSVSKVVTAWSVMAAVEAGQLDLDRPVLEALEQWEPKEEDSRWSRITPRLLLSHASGASFGPGRGLMGYDRDEKLPSLPAVLDGVDGAKNPPLELRGEPGAATLYAAAGYALLQALVEDTTGRAFAEQAESTVFQPLGMTGSTFTVPASDVARGHNMYDRPYTPLRFTVTSAAGLYATSTDLAHLLAAASDVGPQAGGGGAIGPESVAEMRARQPGGDHAPFGLGWERKLVEINGVDYEIIGHIGGNRGYLAFTRLFPVTGDGIVVVANSDRANVPVHRITCEYLKWKVRGGHCVGPQNIPVRWTKWVVVVMLVLAIHAVTVVIQLRRRLRAVSRPRGWSWWRPVLGVVIVAAWCATLYTSVVASLVFGANDQIPYPYLDPGSHLLTAMVVACCLWLAATAWVPKRP